MYTQGMATTTLDLGSKLLFQGDSARNAYPDSSSLINNILPNIYIAGGIVIFFMILVGGFIVITNAGNKDKIGDGTKIITSAIIGLLVLFASYWIIQLIQVLTGVAILSA